jgi:hypothetical protein
MVTNSYRDAYDRSLTKPTSSGWKLQSGCPGRRLPAKP